MDPRQEESARVSSLSLRALHFSTLDSGRDFQLWGTVHIHQGGHGTHYPFLHLQVQDTAWSKLHTQGSHLSQIVQDVPGWVSQLTSIQLVMCSTRLTAKGSRGEIAALRPNGRGVLGSASHGLQTSAATLYWFICPNTFCSHKWGMF